MRLYEELEWRYANLPVLSGSIPPGTPRLLLALETTCTGLRSTS